MNGKVLGVEYWMRWCYKSDGLQHGGRHSIFGVYIYRVKTCKEHLCFYMNILHSVST